VSKRIGHPEGDDQDDAVDLRSRTDARKERLAREELLMALSEALVSASAAILEKLDLPEGLLDAVRSTQSIRRGAARNRALRLVRAALRSEDFEAIEGKLRDVHGRFHAFVRK
jgi:ribosomal 50S subunit-associated protein YjgA (DUF615 family)